MVHFSYFQTKDIQLKGLGFIGSPILYILFAFCWYIIFLFAEQFQESIKSNWFSVGTVPTCCPNPLQVIESKASQHFSQLIMCNLLSIDLAIEKTVSSSIKVRVYIQVCLWSHFVQKRETGIKKYERFTKKQSQKVGVHMGLSFVNYGTR